MPTDTSTGVQETFENFHIMPKKADVFYCQSKVDFSYAPVSLTALIYYFE